MVNKLLSVFGVFILSGLFVLVAIHTNSFVFSAEPIKPLPGEPCKVEPHKVWTPQEKWVWKQVCEGKIADFNKAEGYGGKLDPKKPDDWPKNRILRSTFLEAILLYEPYRNALHRNGVRIAGAWFPYSVNLSDSRLDHPLWLDKCRFQKEVNLGGINSTSYISLEESLFLDKVNLLEAKIGGQLNMIGSTFNGRLYMDSIQVESYLLMRGGSEFQEVVLLGARIGGQIDMTGSKFNGELDMNGIEVKSDLFMRDGAEFDEVDLGGAKIGGQIDMTGSKFNGKLYMDSLEVKKALFMRNGLEVITLIPVKLVFAVIGGNLELWGSKLNSLDLTGTHIGKELTLGSMEAPPAKWKQAAKLTLRNTEIGALQDLPESWPDELELDGFNYARLGGFQSDSSKDMDSREVSWLKEWIEKDKSYSPQPYEQLAKVLEREGHKDKAKEILYHGKQREYGEAEGIDKIWLSLKGLFIGYGYRVYYAVYWAIGFVVFGMILIYTTNSEIKEKINNNQNSLSYFVEIFFYSLDMLLPIIKLDDNHKVSSLPDEVRYYFYLHHMMGYVLVFFLIAGLSGLVSK